MWKVHLKLFLRECGKKYSFVFVVIIAQCIGLHNLIQQYSLIENREWNLHLADYVVYFFQGTIPYMMSGSEEAFNIPPYWSLYLIYFILLIGKMTGQFSKKYEQQMLLRIESRKRWWLEINFKIVLECAGYLVATGICFLIFSLCTRTQIRGINIEVLREYLGIEVIEKKRVETILIGIIFFLALLAFAYIQQVVSMVTNAVVGILISVAVLVTSVYQIHPFLIGNYLMEIRQEMFYMEGINAEVQGAVNAVLILIMVIIGYQILKRKDLF